MHIDAHARFPEGRRDDGVALGVHVQLSVLVDRNNRRIARRILQMLLHVAGQRIVLRVSCDMQGVIAADDKIEIALLAGQNRRAGERDENFIDIFGRRVGRGLLRAGLPEEQMEPAPGRKQALIHVAFEVIAGGIPLGVVLQREHWLDLIRPDPQIVAAVPRIKLARFRVARQIREIIARLIEKGVFRERAVRAVGVILRKKVDGRDGVDVHARVFQQIPDIKPARKNQIRAPAAVAVGIELLVRVERTAVPVVQLLPRKARLFNVFLLTPAEIADADRNGIRHGVGQSGKRQRRAEQEQQRQSCQKFFHCASFSVEWASIPRAASSLRS